MLRVLKEPSQWDGSFEHPKQVFKLMGKNIIKILRNKISLSGPMMLVLTICKPRTSNECRYDEWNSDELQENNLS